MPNASELERDACPDCLVLERENAELKRRLIELEIVRDELEEIRRNWSKVIQSLPGYLLPDNTLSVSPIVRS